MGYVDRFDKNCALFRLRLKRCIKRYHRALFMWYVSLVVNNIIALFDSLFANADELKRSKETSGLGYNHWFSNELGNQLIEKGIHMAGTLKISDAALRITSFSRLVVAKHRVSKLRAAAQAPETPTCQLQSVRMRRSDRRCQLQSLKAGRPFKRKRAGGRPKKKVCSVLAVTLTTIPHPHPRIHTRIPPYHHQSNACLICD